MLSQLAALLDSFVSIGLGYLSLDRETSTLSGGETQRTRMVRHLGSNLTDVTYIFDEPTIGLHAHDVHQMNDLLRRLRDKGNTVLVVEHDPEVIRIQFFEPPGIELTAAMQKEVEKHFSRGELRRVAADEVDEALGIVRRVLARLR